MPKRTVPAWWATPAMPISFLRYAGARDEVIGMHAQMAEHGLQLPVQALRGLLVGGLVGQLDAAVWRERDPVVGARQVLGREPEVDAVCAATSSRLNVGASFVSSGFSPLNICASDLPTIWMLPSGKREIIAPEVEVVEAQGLLEHRRVGLLGDGQHGDAVVEHVVAADLVGAVGQAAGMPVVRRREQQLGRVRGPGRDHDDVSPVGDRVAVLR